MQLALRPSERRHRLPPNCPTCVLSRTGAWPGVATESTTLSRLVRGHLFMHRVKGRLLAHGRDSQ
jgi:hypothetical protein